MEKLLISIWPLPRFDFLRHFDDVSLPSPTLILVSPLSDAFSVGDGVLAVTQDDGGFGDGGVTTDTSP